jgi:signal transduction histidine kinase
MPALTLEGHSSVVEVEHGPRVASSTEARPGLSSPTARGPSPDRIHRRPGTVPVLVLAGLAAVVLVTTGVMLCVENQTRGEPWQARLIILMSAAWIGVVLACGVGLWSWWRAPANPTGRLLYLAGVCFCVYMIAENVPYAPWVRELGWSALLVLPLLALVVLGWPTGRPSRRVRQAVVVTAAAVAVIKLGSGVFARSPFPSDEWPDWPHSVFSVWLVWALTDPIQALVFQAIPAIATVVLLIRRRRAVPPAVRPLITPITVAGVLVAGSLILVHIGYQVFRPLIPVVEGMGDISTVDLLIALGHYLNLAIVAVGVLVAAARRRRAVAVGTRQMLVDLRSATPVVSPSAAAAAIVGDPSAVVRYRRADGKWISSTGTPVEGIAADRRLLPVVDEAGELTAALEVNSSTRVPPLLADLAVSAIAARAANERAAAIADTRRLEVIGRSKALVAAADAGRISLERNLHDGAQQLLVGLALTAGLRVRQESRDSATGVRLSPAAAELITQIGQVRQEILELIDSSTPAALSAGLAGALRSLAAVGSITVLFDADGDLDPDDPLSLGLYLAAGEALANATKHSGAAEITMTLTAHSDTVRIMVQDNGIGGVDRVPASLAARVDDLPGHVRIDSPHGVGTTVLITATRAMVGAR